MIIPAHMMIPAQEREEIEVSIGLFLGVVGFIISALLLPLIAYVWVQRDKAIKDIKALCFQKFKENMDKIDKHIEGKPSFHKEIDDNLANLRQEMSSKINSVELELSKTKLNYVDRFMILGNLINDKFTDTNKAIKDIAVNMAEVKSSVNELGNIKITKPRTKKKEQ